MGQKGFWYIENTKLFTIAMQMDGGKRMCDFSSLDNVEPQIQHNL